MRKGSIAFSLFWLSAGWLILALAGTAFLLTDLYSRALDTNLTNQLKFNIDTLSSRTLDSTDPNFGDIGLTDPRFNRGVRQVQQQGLVYEVLVRGAGQLAATPAFCARHDQHFLVLDHLGKPAIGGGADNAWRDALRELAAMPHVLCKLSGLVTEVVGGGVDDAVLRRYLDTALELFGPAIAIDDNSD